MLPVIALVGRPNVGKSTLFNHLTRSRDALVANRPGITRDRIYGIGRVGGGGYMVVDTGGLSGEGEGIDAHMAAQTWRAVEEADAVFFLVDGREGLTAADEEVAARLRGTGKPVWLLVNKTDGLDGELACAEFHRLGLGRPHAVSAAHGRGVKAVLQRALAELPPGEPEPPEEDDAVRVAIVGRPNVGKSTLVNRLLGEERVLAYDEPGTTRDSIRIPFVRDGRRYLLIDTAGVRRRARIRDFVEKFSVVKAFQAMEAAHVVVLMVDAREGVVEQDAALAGLAVESGRAVVVAVNKWDRLPEAQRRAVGRELELRLGFLLEFAPVRRISALHGSGLEELMAAVDRAHRAATADLATPELTRILQEAVARHQPPLVRGRRIKLRYAHQGGRNPPVIVVHGNRTELLPEHYRRYLANAFREALDLFGTPVRVELRSGENPFAGRRNELTPRQIRKRRRLMRHVKRS
ncbi:ribosome biogenesis GTPase Der [Inmirania thermothiophila]|uniref:GTPase Der n=1 Tax=Inmirania thermothiophila TaxID=1750597 RepID=A0A3N1YBX5_9GAMM|nr:ribosome biogenesis GTPase Der [Inmirania thermothiophila]ROR34887.1 GTP-binding protein [Inmirania thermothiophila]